MALLAEMPVAAVARIVGEWDTKLWRVLKHYVAKARAKRSDRKVRKVGIDETSSRRGHNYITNFVDLEVPRVLFATEGRIPRRFRRSPRTWSPTAAIRPRSPTYAWT